MSSLIVAERRRRQWHRWAAEHLGTYQSFPVSDERDRILALRAWKERHGAARCYEVQGYEPDSALNVVLEAMRNICLGDVLVLVGDTESPALFKIGTTDIERVLRHGVDVGDLVFLMPAERPESLLIDLPESRRGETFIIANGGWEPIIDVLLTKLPGGHEFRGN